MTRGTFLDTAYLLALLNPRDAWHAKAVALSGRPLGRLVTTQAVLTEFADALASPLHRRWAAQAIDDLMRDANITCVTVDGQLFEDGLGLYRARADKAWSLTDCISFAVMKARGMTDALTADAHFSQAGFRALMRD